MLLKLPTELIQMILGYTSPSAYVQVAISCKRLYAIATTSRNLVVDHLQRTPGVLLGPDSRSTLYLFRLLQARVAELLLNASSYADRTTYTFNGKRHDLGASSTGRVEGFTVLALVLQDDYRVHLLYTDSNGAVVFQQSVDCSPPAPEESPGTVVKTTFSRNDSLGVLVRGHTIRDKLDDNHVFSEELRNSDSYYYYFFYIPLTGNRPRSVCRVYERSDFEPTAFACSKETGIFFFVSWRDLLDDTQHEIVFYNTATDYVDEEAQEADTYFLTYKAETLADEHGPRADLFREPDWVIYERPPLWTLGPVTDIKVRSTTALFSYRGSALFDYFQGFIFDGDYFLNVVENLSDVHLFDTPFAVTPPFFKRLEEGEGQRSIWFLSFGTSIHPTGQAPVACLLRSVDEINLSLDDHDSSDSAWYEVLSTRRYIPVARLMGYQQPMSTMNCSPAASPKGTRFAVAGWDVVYIWALNPVDLTQKDLQQNGFYPREWRSSEFDEVVELHPAVVRLDAVCFHIVFTENEDILLALTDKGLVAVDLRPQGRGRRLTFDIPIP